MRVFVSILACAYLVMSLVANVHLLDKGGAAGDADRVLASTAACQVVAGHVCGDTSGKAAAENHGLCIFHFAVLGLPCEATLTLPRVALRYEFSDTQLRELVVSGPERPPRMFS